MLKIGFSPVYKLGLPPEHRFPMLKYELIPEQLMYEGTVNSSNFFVPKPITEDVIHLTHTKSYWERLKNLSLTDKEIRRIGFPMTQNLVDRCIAIGGATLMCADFAEKFGVAMNVAGGTHHAFADKGEGFCLLNDVAMAANALIAEKRAAKILVIDLDVHQGNGTAHIFRNSENMWNGERGVFTFSMHGANNFPLHKEQSDLDIALADKTGDSFYLKVLKENLSLLIDTIQPDIAFFNSGVDVLETDKLGKLNLSLAGCKQRDKTVFDLCKKNKIPVVVSMGGGYSPLLSTIIEAHANTFRVAQEIYF